MIIDPAPGKHYPVFSQISMHKDATDFRVDKITLKLSHDRKQKYIGGWMVSHRIIIRVIEAFGESTR